MQAHRFRTHSLRDDHITAILAAALDAVDPGRLVISYFEKHGVPSAGRIYLLGMGKAAEEMTVAAARSLTHVVAGLIVTNKAQRGETAGLPEMSQPEVAGLLPALRMLEAGHPIPDARSIAAGQIALDFVAKLGADDLLVCLVSGGASALAAAPRGGISLHDLQSVTAALLSSGANIDEINTIRRQLDRLKGGGLAAATKARVLSLIISDVVGDRLESIASGPTAPNPSTNSDAVKILRDYGVRTPRSIDEFLATPTPVRSISPERVQNQVLANNRTAIDGALSAARSAGLNAETFPTPLQGEAATVGSKIGRTMPAETAGKARPFCLIAGGETTVTLRGHGRGGRNQELALAAVEGLANMPGAILVALATDGNDGPTDAAGAVVTSSTRHRATALGFTPSDYLSKHDSYAFFDALGDLLRPGQTGTNVSDLLFLIGL